MTRLDRGADARRDWHSGRKKSWAPGSVVAAKRLASRRVTVTIPPDMPARRHRRSLIEQVLVNLLDNAVKYAAPEGAIRLMATATERA